MNFFLQPPQSPISFSLFVFPHFIPRFSPLPQEGALLFVYFHKTLLTAFSQGKTYVIIKLNLNHLTNLSCQASFFQSTIRGDNKNGCSQL